MKSKAHLVIAVALIAAAAPCHAGGTLGTGELVPLLSQKPDVYEALSAAFELKDSAFAWVRLGSHYEHLGGRRLGPYEIEAKVRASGKKIIVVLCTEAAYFDERGEGSAKRCRRIRLLG